MSSSDLYDYAEDGTYCYPGSSVLRNRFNIRDESTLRKFERHIAALRMSEIDSGEMDFGNRFDACHLCSLHRFLFGDIYEWAGNYRTVDISKGVQFCLAQYIPGQLDDLLDRLKDERLLEGLPLEALVKRLAYYLGEINAIHPFREGNGRAQRTFIRQLARKNGYQLSFADVSEQEMIPASINSFNGDYTDLEDLIGRNLSRISSQHE